MKFIVICNSPKECLDFLRINKICVSDLFFLINNFITTFDNDVLEYNNIFFTSFNYKKLVSADFFNNEMCIQNFEYAIRNEKYEISSGRLVIIPATYSSRISDRLLLKNIDLKFKYINDVDRSCPELLKTVEKPVKYNELLAKGFDSNFLKAAIFPSNIFSPDDFKPLGMWRISDFFTKFSLEVSYNASIKFFKVTF